MYCEKCGKELPTEATFCPHCGQSIGQKTEGKEASVNQKTFHPKQNAGLASKALCAGCGVGAVLLIYAYSQLPWYTSNQDRYILMCAIVITVVVCLQNLLGIFNRGKVQLHLDENTVSGVTVNGISIRKFEYRYSEITDVMCKMGSVTIRANGKWMAIPGLEGAEQAKVMIEQRIVKK